MTTRIVPFSAPSTGSIDELRNLIDTLSQALGVLTTAVKAGHPGELLTADELGERFRIPARTLRDLASAGQIPHHRIGKHYRFAVDDIADILRITRQMPVSRHVRARLAAA